VHGRDQPLLCRARGSGRIAPPARVLNMTREVLARILIVAPMIVLLGGTGVIGQERSIKGAATGQRDNRAPEPHSTQPGDTQTAKPIGSSLRREDSPDNLSGISMLLGLSPERRQLAAELKELLQQDKIEAAEEHLNTAIEIGSLAVFLTQRLRDPKFLETLQSLSGLPVGRSNPPRAAADAPATPPTDSTGEALAQRDKSELSQLKEEKVSGQQRADALTQELAAANEELDRLRTLQEKEARSTTESILQLTELKAALEREQERGDTATRNFVRVQQEHRALQTMREEDAALIASSRMEVNELKEALEKERQRNGTPVAAILNKEPSSRGRNNPSEITSGTAGLPRTLVPSSTGSVALEGLISTQPGLKRLSGIPKVLDTSTLTLQGQAVRLFGVETTGDVASADELTQYVRGREVACEPVAPPNTYRCKVDGKDLSVVVLFNGGGRVTADATSELKTAAQRARSARIGIWNSSNSNK
jgi:endonuclease YncB( thermonuclease family)